MKECGTGGAALDSNVDLVKELNDNNARTMAVQTNVLESISGQIQVGRRQELFWLVMAVIVSGVLISISIFGKKRKRRR